MSAFTSCGTGAGVAVACRDDTAVAVLAISDTTSERLSGFVEAVPPAAAGGGAEAAADGDARGVLLLGPAVSLRNRPRPKTPRSGFRAEDDVGGDCKGCTSGFGFIACF